MPHNHLVTRDGRLVVDWESSLLAPAERDLRWLVAAAVDVPADPAMVRLFVLDWRLAEVDAYSAWLAAPHPGSESDRIALEGLREELAGDDE
jgi:spectinomycin phosphotransferase